MTTPTASEVPDVPDYAFEGLKGVGTLELRLLPEQQAYVLFGANGAGKTKCLEALFQLYFFAVNKVKPIPLEIGHSELPREKFVAEISKTVDGPAFPGYDLSDNHSGNRSQQSSPVIRINAEPAVFLGAGARGHLPPYTPIDPNQAIGNFALRQQQYLQRVIHDMDPELFASMGTNISLEQWFVTIAKSSNPFQVSDDNRFVEIETLFRLLNQIDDRFDADPRSMLVDGNNRVYFKLGGVKTALQNLSTGFLSLVRIMQAIVSGYSCYTQSHDLQNVKGTVFIDEIESHLHLEWQAKIVSALKKLFPNTRFFITTHSPLVLSQLREGEAYLLKRDEDNVVRSSVIVSPGRRGLVDVVNGTFGVNLMALQRDRMLGEDQTEVKAKLLDLLHRARDSA